MRRLAVGFLLSLQACGGGAKHDEDPPTPQPGLSALPERCEPKVSPEGDLCVDDFEDNDELLDRTANLQGLWYVENDGTGEQSPAAGADRVPGSLLAEPGAPRSVKYALHTSGQRFQRWGAFVAVKLNASRFAGCTYDISSHSGLTVAVKGAGTMRINLGTKRTLPIEDGGECNSETETCSDYGRVIKLATAWQRVDVAFDELTQPEWATPAEWDPSQALRISFWAEQEDFDFWLDDLRFY